jgi:hypothetical protein
MKECMFYYRISVSCKQGHTHFKIKGQTKNEMIKNNLWMDATKINSPNDLMMFHRNRN